MASMSSLLSSGGNIESSSSLSALLRVLVNIPSSSKCANVIILPVYSLKDVEQGVSQSHLNFNQREARYKIRDRIMQRKLVLKGALKSTQNMGKGLHYLFKTVVKEISQELPALG